MPWGNDKHHIRSNTAVFLVAFDCLVFIGGMAAAKNNKCYRFLALRVALAAGGIGPDLRLKRVRDRWGGNIKLQIAGNINALCDDSERLEVRRVLRVWGGDKTYA